MIVDRQEAIDLLAERAALMAKNDAPHLAAQRLPEGIESIKDLPYLEDGLSDHLLDIYRPEDAAEDEPLPVFIDFHGGGLYYGTKENNLCRDMILAGKGFVVVNANYRLVPQVSFFDQISDALAVMAWVKEHVAEYQGNPDQVFVTGDSAGATLAMYALAVNNSKVVRQRWFMQPSGLSVRGFVATSGMFRLEGGVYEPLISYYTAAYFTKPSEIIAIAPYKNDLDRLIVDGNLPPTYLITSDEDVLADNSLELARIMVHRNRDCELRMWPLGQDKVLGHIFNVTQAGDASNAEALEVIDDIARFARRYL
ncbi:esterase/lipase [Bifidobacterium saguini DSM 23967]|uniref:Esterase/lipase n=2 Tax=Bifidobacterium saguini TaxID=762210 RepID=A0A087D8T5_9BIFI|nr:alpha/beta hydrolase [Bifidobacterium saguini]KFI91935.1 esterase/lipase [Bifidobacterium saguini DSM 23967]